MAELLLRALARAGQTMPNPFSTGRDYVRPQRGEIARDFQRVAKDMNTVSKDLDKTVQRELQRHVQ